MQSCSRLSSTCQLHTEQPSYDPPHLLQRRRFSCLTAAAQRHFLYSALHTSLTQSVCLCRLKSQVPLESCRKSAGVSLSRRLDKKMARCDLYTPVVYAMLGHDVAVHDAQSQHALILAISRLYCSSRLQRVLVIIFNMLGFHVKHQCEH